MAITLKADQRTLLLNAEFSYLSTNYAAAVSSFVLTNVNNFSVELGDSTTQFDITNPSGTTFRYTWDGTGTTPGTFSSLISVGGSIVLNAQNFSAANNGTFTITGVSSTYFEVTNAAGVVESNKTIGTGTIKIYIYILLGEFGQEQSEVLIVSAVTASTNTITTTANSKFAHPESTKVTIIKYNQVRFYYSTSATDTAPTALATYQDIEPDDFYSKYYDTTYTTGYGFFLFYNSTTLKATAYSNAIPYADFGLSTVSQIFDSFFSILNNKERKMITDDDAFAWLNEAYSFVQNELNLVNESFTVPAQTSIAVTSGTAEYALASDFSSVVSVTESDDGTEIGFLPLRDVAYYRDSNATSSLTVKYYLRGAYIGFVPTPTSSATYYLYYKAKTSRISSYSSTVDMPNNEFYPLLDFMMYRASLKLNKPNPTGYLQLFKDRINTMKIISHKQYGGYDSFEIDTFANI